MSAQKSTPRPVNATAVIVLADGTILWGRGFGAEKTNVGEICFNTAMTGYQEIMTDPSYAGQIVTFTFPHIGNVGANAEDIETINPVARGMIVREDITGPSSWRSLKHWDAWLKAHDIPGISGIDTRALTHRIRDQGAPNGVICHEPSGSFDLDALLKMARDWPGLEGMDLAEGVSCTQTYTWEEGLWRPQPSPDALRASPSPTGRGRGHSEAGEGEGQPHVVAVDYGAKRNILRCLAEAGCRVTVVPATSSFEDIMGHKPDGIFLSNGPGDPAATGVYALSVIRKLIETELPIFGICLGHQLLGLALGGKTRKMALGHRGANHPVKNLDNGRVYITSQNHGFEVVSDTLPKNAVTTHVSLFDGSNQGLRMTDKPVFSVQYHPEASPGPQESFELFEQFVGMMK